MLIRAPLKSPLNRSPTKAWETLGGLFQSADCFSQSIPLPGFLTPLEKMDKKGHQHWNQKLLFLGRKVTPLLHETCGGSLTVSSKQISPKLPFSLVYV